MKIEDIILTEKHIDILKDNTQVIFAEGVTNSGKSFILGIKFIKEILNAPANKNQFMIAGQSTPVLEKMYIQNPASFYNIFNDICEYKQQGKGGSRIEVRTPSGPKFIYLVGYDNARRWKDILGLTIAGSLIEEINIANDDFIAELFIRTFRNSGFLYASSNGAEDTLRVYTKYLDKGRPLKKYEHEVPQETMDLLNKQTPSERYRYYFFTFKDNKTMKQEEIDALFEEIPEGSWEYITKLLGLRGVREGAIFAPYMNREKNIIRTKDLYKPDTEYPIYRYTIGVDVGGADNTVITLNGFTYNNKEQIVIDYIEFNQLGTQDMFEKFKTWYTPYHLSLHRDKVLGVFIDSSALVTKLSLAPLLRNEFNLDITSAYKYTIAERCDTNIRLLHQGRLLFTELTKPFYDSFTKAIYKKNKSETDPREFRDHADKDRVDSVEYGQSPVTKALITSTIYSLR